MAIDVVPVGTRLTFIMGTGLVEVVVFSLDSNIALIYYRAQLRAFWLGDTVRNITLGGFITYLIGVSGN